MKRDLDRIRDLLLRAEAAAPGHPVQRLFGAEGDWTVDDDHDAEHVEMLDEAGYVLGSVSPKGGGGYLSWHIERLTMDGHDFLDSIRDPAVFRETKQKLSKVGGTAALEVVKAVAQGITNSMLGLG